MGVPCEDRPKLSVPYYPSQDDRGRYVAVTAPEKSVAEYARLSMVDVEDLNVVDFCLLLRDSVIYRCSQTDKGLEYLENCWRITQTKMDKQSLRKKLAKG